MSDQVFSPVGSAEDQAKLLAPLENLYFPWQLLVPELLRTGVGRIGLSFKDLSGYSLALSLDGHITEHVADDEGHSGHALYTEHLPEKFHAAAMGSVAGLAWRDRIEIEIGYRDNPGAVAWILSAEVAHHTDFYWIEPNGMRQALNALLHPSGPDSHGWFEGEYYSRSGEAWMHGFGMAYGSGTVDPRFLHVFTREMIPAIHEILRAGRTDYEPPPPPPPDPGTVPIIKNVFPKGGGNKKWRVKGKNFHEDARLYIDGSDTGAVESDGMFTFRRVFVSGTHQATVRNPQRTSEPFEFVVVE